MANAAAWLWRAVDGGAELRVRATPNAGKDAVEGPAADASGQRYLKVRVRAAPENGEANAAVEALLAKALGVPKSSVSVARGQTQRLKTLRIEARAGLEAALAELADGGRDGG